MKNILRFIATMLVVAATASAQEPADFRSKSTPVCELAGIVARPPAGWINVPIEGASAPGHLGCQMFRFDDSEELVGILRVRSAAAPASEFSSKSDEALIARERDVIRRMNIEVAAKPLWTRDGLPIRGAGFTDAHGAGYAATVAGNDIPQEVHFLSFRSKTARYLITLITPAKSQVPAVYERNTDDFGLVMRSFTLK